MKSETSLVLNTMLQSLIIFIVCLLAQAPSIYGQTISVLVKAESPLDIKRIDINVSLTESKLDYVIPEYPDYPKPELISAEKFLLELNSSHLKNTKIGSKTDSKKYYSRATKKEQVETTVISNFQIIIDNNDDLAKFKEVMSKFPNVKIISTDFSSKNENNTLKQLTEELLKEARISADKIGKMINKRTTNLSNIKVINMQTKGNPKHLMLYVLEQNAYMELEVTYDTENL